MPTLILDPPPVEIEALLEHRRRIGADTHDEVWEGVLHMAPAPHGRHAFVQQRLAVLLDAPARSAGLTPVGEFNLGTPDDFRVPDGGVLHPGGLSLYVDSAALVVEVVSPGDESREKLGFYAAHGVQEVLIVDPLTRSIDWLALTDAGEYRPVQHSGVIELGVAELTQRIDWPPLDER